MKELSFSVIIMLVLFIFQNSLFSQETYTHQEAKITITIPGGWYYEVNGATIKMCPQSNELGIGFNLIEASEMELAGQKVAENIKANYPDATFDNPTEQDINGMKSYTIKARTPDGTIISYTLIITPAIKILEMGYMGHRETIDKYNEDLITIITGINPLN